MRISKTDANFVIHVNGITLLKLRWQTQCIQLICKIQTAQSLKPENTEWKMTKFILAMTSPNQTNPIVIFGDSAESVSTQFAEQIAQEGGVENYEEMIISMGGFDICEGVVIFDLDTGQQVRFDIEMVPILSIK